MFLPVNIKTCFVKKFMKIMYSPLWKTDYKIPFTEKFTEKSFV